MLDLQGREKDIFKGGGAAGGGGVLGFYEKVINVLISSLKTGQYNYTYMYIYNLLCVYMYHLDYIISYAYIYIYIYIYMCVYCLWICCIFVNDPMRDASMYIVYSV